VVGKGLRTIAVDWSGGKEPLKNLWLAEAGPGRLLDVASFSQRASVTDYLIAESQADPELVVGLDFAFSLPAWFLAERRFASAHALWQHMASEADTWLQPKPPFWTAAGGGPKDADPYRQTDRELMQRNLRPTSPFKLVGPSQVGRGSLRGMGHLLDLQRAGFNIWPFASGLPLVVEIYPAALYPPGFAGKSHPRAIAEAVRDNPRIGEGLKAHAACSQDAFDAATSALRMAECAPEFRNLRPARPETRYALEGQIWTEGESTQLPP
jgi:hypothetical protein